MYAVNEWSLLFRTRKLEPKTFACVVLSCRRQPGPNSTFPEQAEFYSPPNQVPIRSRPRSISADEVAYDKRMCSVVPKASPGTVTTCASWRRRLATSAAERMPALPKYAETLG